MLTAPAKMRTLSSLPLSNLYTLVRPVSIDPGSPKSRFTNWGLSFSCKPLAVFEPETELQCQAILEIARREGKTVRAAGVGHSPSDLACTEGFMVLMTRMKSILEVNLEKKYVVAQGGITLADLHDELAVHGLAMSNVGSISDQTLAGIVTTATHGTGMDYGVMSTHVLAMKLLLADGSFAYCSHRERPDLFTATLCGLGSTGLILSIQLQVEPAFLLKDVQETHSFDFMVQNFDTIAHSAEHVRMWWFAQSDTVRISYLDRTSEPRKPAGSWLWNSFCSYHLVQFLLFLGRFFAWVNPWTARFAAWLVSRPSVGIDDSHRIFNVDCRYPQHTTEWAIPYQRSQACLRELRDWLLEEHQDPNGLRPHFPVEIRFSAPDDIWLSPSNGQHTCWLGIVQYRPYGLDVTHKQIFERYESIVSRHHGRPHWAKAHRLRPSDLRTLYPRFDDFVRVLDEVDPLGIFRNPYVRRHIFGDELRDDAFRTARPF